MKLTNVKHDLTIKFKENKVDVLVIENATAMSEIIGDLYRQSMGIEGDFLLSQDNKELRVDKNVEFIINPFAIDFNDKKIVNKLYKELEITGNELVVEKMKINSEVTQLLEKIVDKAQYDNIDYNLEFNWINLFKLYDVKINYDYNTLLEKMIVYVKILSELCNIKVLCMLNIKSFFTDEEIAQLYEMVFYYKIQLLLIESSEKDKMLEENIYIIDKDRCLITK